MKALDIVPTAQNSDGYTFNGSVAVVIDVLRATTSIQAILENGGRRVYPVETVEEAKTLKDRMPNALLCGERGGFPPEGFDMGNSPVAFSRADLSGRDVILTTTNGTLAVKHAASAKVLLSACMRNPRAVVSYILSGVGAMSAVLVCAGTEGSFSIEDFYAAGLIASVIGEDGEWRLTDIAWVAAKLAKTPIGSAVNSTTCRHLGILLEKGFEEDVAFSIGADTDSAFQSKLVPVYDAEKKCFYS